MPNRQVGQEAPCKRLLIVLCAVFAFGLLARPAAAGTITVAWDLMTDSKVTGYRVFVGTSPGRYTETFDVPADRYFHIFRSAFMGVRYYFSVAAQFDNSTFGPRAHEVTAVGTRTVGGAPPDGARVGEPTVVSDCAADCYVVTDLARGLGEVSSLAVSNGGTIFAVEGRRRVVVVQDGPAAIAFEAEAGTTLGEIALDPQFDTTGRVFVTVLRRRDGSDADLELVRLRYLAGTLAEPSAIVTGASVPLAGAVPLAVDRDGLLYLAVPKTAGRGPYSSAVLAFDQDGRVPAGWRPTTPVIAQGLDAPADLAWDGEAGVLWLGGRNEGAGTRVLAVSRRGISAGAPDVLGAADSLSAVAIASGRARRLLVGAGVDLIETTLDGVDVQRIPLDQHGEVVAVAALPAGGNLVAVRRDALSGPTFSIMKVEAGLTHFTR